MEFFLVAESKNTEFRGRLLKSIQTVKLNDELLLAKGGERHCYIHPEDSQKVIKVYKENNRNKQNDLEYLYYNYLTKRKLDLAILLDVLVI